MIKCPVCGSENYQFEAICSNCKGFIQPHDKVVNLFETIWGLMEHPRTTFRKLFLARRKNYLMVLATLSGISVMFKIMWWQNAASFFSDLFMLIGICLGLGIPFGILLLFSGSLLVRGVSHLYQGELRWKDSASLVSFSAIPLVFSLVFLLPIEIAIFGQDLFGTNPPPMILNPNVYITLLGLEALALLWAFCLLVVGMAVGNSFHLPKAILASGTTLITPVVLILLGQG